MKNILFKFFTFCFWLSAFCFQLHAQETPPTGLKPVNGQFYINLTDSSIWHYKGVPYGWERLARFKEIIGVTQPLSDSSKKNASTEFVKQFAASQVTYFDSVFFARHGDTITFIGSGGATDTTIYQTVANFFPKGDTRYYKKPSGTTLQYVRGDGSLATLPVATVTGVTGGALTLTGTSIKFGGTMTGNATLFTGGHNFSVINNVLGGAIFVDGFGNSSLTSSSSQYNGIISAENNTDHGATEYGLQDAITLAPSEIIVDGNQKRMLVIDSNWNRGLQMSKHPNYDIASGGSLQQLADVQLVDSLITAAGGGGGGLSSITPGVGFVSHTPITSSGTMNIDSAGTMASKAWSLAAFNTKVQTVKYTDTASMLSPIVHINGAETILGQKTYSVPIILASQGSKPSTPASGFQKLYLNAAGQLSYLGNTGFEIAFSKGAFTGDHVKYFADATDTLVDATRFRALAADLNTTNTNLSTNYAQLVSPAFTTPNIGAANGTSFNKISFTAPATSATFSPANGSTLATTGAFTINLTAAGNSTPTFPNGAGSLAYIGSINSWSAANSFSVSAAIRHLSGFGSAATIAAGTGAGTSPTVSITGTDLDGVVSITTGTSPAGSNAIVATITFNTAYTAAPKVVLLPANRNAQAISITAPVVVPAAGQTNGVTTTTFVIESGATALAASTLYMYTYQVML